MEKRTKITAEAKKPISVFDLAENFVRRQEALADELIKKLPDTQSISTFDMYQECWALANEWMKDDDCSLDEDIKDWALYDEYCPYGCDINPSPGSLMKSISYCAVAADYNVRLLHQHLKTKGAVPYRPIRIWPASERIYDARYLCYTSECKYDFDSQYYDDENLVLKKLSEM
jgi:hypothetical protein